MLVQVHVMATCSIHAYMYVLELSHLQYNEVVNVVHVHMDVQHEGMYTYERVCIGA